MNPRNRWSQPPASWDTPGWAPLVDHGPLPLQTARSVGRWLWPTLSVGGFLLVTGFVFGHDDPTPGLSLRGLCTIALAAAVVILLTIRRTAGPGPLARALFEYAVVFLLAVLVATTGVDVDQAPAGGDAPARPGSAAGPGQDHRRVPRLAQPVAGLGPQRDRPPPPVLRHRSRSHGPGMAPSPALSPSTRRPL